MSPLGLVLRLACSALAVWLSTVLISGISVTAETTAGKVAIVLIVAVVFGVVNAIIKPVVKVLGCGVYVLTLGLVSFLVNGLLFWLTSVIINAVAGSKVFVIANLWSAILGALIVGLVSFALGLLIKDRGE
jgi:putative membrane protein